MHHQLNSGQTAYFFDVLVCFRYSFDIIFDTTLRNVQLGLCLDQLLFERIDRFCQSLDLAAFC